MKNRVYALLIGMAFALAACGTGYAMSTLITVNVEPEWPATTDPGTVIVYKVTAVDRTGQGMLEVALSSGGMPDGTTVSFSPSVLRFTGQVPETRTATMTVTCATVTPIDLYPFTVTGTARRETVTWTNQVPPSYAGDINSRRPTLLIDRLQPASVKVRGAGASGKTYQIETTTNLGNPGWTPFSTCTADGNGRFTAAYPIAHNDPVRFFRAVCPAPTP